MKTIIDEELKRYNDLLIEEEKEVLIEHINNKIKFLQHDLLTLREDYDTYSKTIKRFINVESVEKFVNKIIEDYIYKYKCENEDILLVLSGDKKSIEKKVSNKAKKDKFKKAQKDVQKILKGLNLKMRFEFKEDGLSEEEKEKKEKIVMEGYKRVMVDYAMHDLNVSRSFESQDISYYKRLIEKIKNNGKVTLSDGQELWCMCDNKEHEGEHNDLHKPIIDKLKEYTKKLNEKEVENNDEEAV